MREPWRSFLYVLLVGSLPLAFWYAIWPHRRRLKKPSDEPTPSIEPAIGTDG